MKKRTTAVALMLAFLLSACGGSAGAANSENIADSAVSESAEAVSTTAQAQESASSAAGQTEQADVAASSSVTEASSADEGGTEETQPSAGTERYENPVIGMSVPLPETYLANTDKIYLQSNGYAMGDGFFILEQILFPDNHENLVAITDEAEREAVGEQAIFLLVVLKTDDDIWTREEVEEWYRQTLGENAKELEVLGQEGGYTSYAFGDTEYADDLPEETKRLYDAVIKEAAQAKREIIHTEPLDEKTASMGVKLDFTTTDTEGNPVSSSELFAANQVTMVNCWATWCGPCIREIPELEQINKRLREKGCEVIGVIMDANEEGAMAEGLDILATAGATYRNILPWDSFDEDLYLQAYPTTFFINAEGKVIGEALVGAYVDLYEEEVEKLLADM